MAPLRVYVDNSVIEGCFDEAFRESSRKLFARAKAGEIVVLVSDIVVRELKNAPNEVRDVLQSLPHACVEHWSISPDVETLRNAYLIAGVVGRRSREDATHVAVATIARADAIVSWNFKHIVQLERIKGYNRVNWEMVYGVMTIVSPPALVGDGTEEEEEL
jgi:predicted nucleic acid-binding protein